MMRMRALWAVGLALASPLAAQAQQATRDAAERWLARRPFTEQVADDLPAGLAFQAAFVERLTAHLGRPAGYKAALTNPAAQQRFGANGPVLGVLLDGMLRASGAAMPADFAARPVVEGDLLVRVGSAAINEAGTDLDLLAGLDAVMPFLELADLNWSTNAIPTAASLVALNAGARAGVYGAPVPLQEATPEQLDRLAGITVVLYDGAGVARATGRARDLLGHPIQAVRWIRDELRARGDRLRPGDVLSLGSLTPLLPVQPGDRWTATYEGLGTDGTVSVTCSIATP